MVTDRRLTDYPLQERRADRFQPFPANGLRKPQRCKRSCCSAFGSEAKRSVRRFVECAQLLRCLNGTGTLHTICWPARDPLI
jgi:hypothetical protein